MGLARLAGREVTAPEVAGLLERGARSGIGIGAFQHGGFILDGGSAADGAPPPVTARLPFPEPWRVLLIFDPAASGLHGSGESGAFQRLPPYTAELAGQLCREVVMQLLPGLATADLAAVGQAVGLIQREVGDYFAPAQGGRFTSAAVSEALAWLEAQGIAGVGQSSWGPTGFALLGGEAQASELVRDAATALFRPAVPGHVRPQPGCRNHHRRLTAADCLAAGRDGCRTGAISGDVDERAEIHPALRHAAQERQPVRRQHGDRCRLRRDRSLQRRRPEGGRGPGPGRDLQPRAAGRATHGGADRRARAAARDRHAGGGQTCDGAAPFPDLGDGRPIRCIHHGRRHDRGRGEAPARQEREPLGQRGGRVRWHRACRQDRSADRGPGRRQGDVGRL